MQARDNSHISVGDALTANLQIKPYQDEAVMLRWEILPEITDIKVGGARKPALG
ncbi:MAG: hypothetical protein HWE26_08670 [Alteromonadaceae bacterium]|nr:hypothetical protein [Alteromonadaceae bacterium]